MPASTMCAGSPVDSRTLPGALALPVLLTLLLFLCFTTSMAHAAGPAPPVRLDVDADGIVVTFAPGDQALAEEVLRVTIEERESLLRRFPEARLAALEVDVAASREEFNRLTRGGVPDWGVGCAMIGERRIVLRSPQGGGAPRRLGTVLRHELAHLAAYDALGTVSAPRWFHEGVASAAAGEWRLEESAALAVAAWSGGLSGPAALERSFPEAADAARLAYAESYQAVLLFAELSGDLSIPELVRAVGGHRDFDTALGNLTGLDARAFDAAFAERVKQRFGLALLLRRTDLLFLAAAALVLVGAALTWLRSRRRLKQWEREESDGSERDRGRRDTWR